MEEDMQLRLDFPGFRKKLVQADFAGGAVTSDGGVLFLRQVDKHLGVIDRYSSCLFDARHQSYVDHSYKEMLTQRVFQIALGYEDCNDSATLTECRYQAGKWPKRRRVILKAEVSHEGQNMRAIVTNIRRGKAKRIYDRLYCARGQMENFIKNHKCALHSDRTSCHRFEANQFRLFLHSAAYVLLHTLQEKGLSGTQYARAQFDTIQVRILKIGARVIEKATRINFHFPTSFPLKAIFATMHENLAVAFP